MTPEKNFVLPDEEIVRAIKQNDHTAFKLLYDNYYQCLIRYALYRIHNLEASKELVQEVFTRVWFARNRLTPEKSIKAYLYKILHNLIINNRQLKSYNLSDIENLEHLADPSDTQSIDLAIDIQKAISSLPEKLRTAFLLSRVDGFKYNEIAEICDVSVKAVEKRLSKAFKLIKNRYLKNYFD